MANQEKFFVEYGVDTDSTTSFKVPAGTTAQRDASPESGLFRYNTSNNQFEGYSNGSWGEIGGSSLGQSFDVDTFTGDNSTTAFTLGRSVSSEDYLIVFIDGVFQAQDAYTLSGTTLTLDSPPATGSSIIAYSVVPISVAEIPADTDDLTEGSTNLYFTNARVDSRLSSGSVATIETSGNVTVGGDLSVSGGLTVSGTTTTVNSTTTSVTDSMIELANSNTSSDVIDIGIYGNYDDGLSEGGVSEYTGLFRDASDSTWKLFDGLEEEPTTTVNIAGTNYAKAALEVGDLDATTITTTDINLENTGGNAVIDIKASNSGLSRVNLGDTDGATRGGLKYDHSNDSMAFRANGSDQMTLTNTGLGIGTNAPDDLLHVYAGNSGAAPHSLSAFNIENSSDVAMNFLTPNTSQAQIRFADPQDDGKGIVGYNHNGDYMFFATNGPEKMRLNSDGNLGVGISTIEQLGSDSVYPRIQSYSSDTSGHFCGLMIGRPNNPGLESSLAFTVGGIMVGKIQHDYVASNHNDMSFHLRGSSGSTDLEVMRLWAGSGSDTALLVGRTTRSWANAALEVESNARIGNIYLTGSGSDSTISAGNANYKFSTATVTCGATDLDFDVNVVVSGVGIANRFKVDSPTGDTYTNDGTISSLSDIRVKTDINDLTDGLEIVKQLRPVTFKYNDNSTDDDGNGMLAAADDKIRYGFIAQEVEEVAPHYVETSTRKINNEEVNDFKSLSTTRMIPMLFKAIQEQQTIIDDLKARIETLENA